MNILAAVVAGVVATLAMTAVMSMAPAMGLPRMEIPKMLGSMFVRDGGAANGLGLMLHLMMGVVFAIIYAIGFTALNAAPTWYTGVLFASAHWLVAMLVMGMMGSVHPRIREGVMSDIGVFMLKLGTMAPVGALMGHWIYGVVVAVVYAGLA